MLCFQKNATEANPQYTNDLKPKPGLASIFAETGPYQAQHDKGLIRI